MKIFKGLFDKPQKPKKIDLTKRFDLLSQMGQGSMSIVWRARDSMSGRIVALKILDKVKTEKLEARFVGMDRPTEGEVSVQLDHPHIVRTFEHGLTLKNEQFLVMEYVDGVSMTFLIDMQNKTLKENRIRFMKELALAIGYLHDQNWIHRDLCPRNILVDDEKKLKLIDFGLVVPNTEPFQQPGNRTGTANYMAPELVKRQRTDHRIDVFSYAVTCFEMWSKSLPWDMGDTFDNAVQRINTPPKQLAQVASETPPKIAKIIMKGLEPQPDKRWQSMSEIVSALEKVSE